MSQSSSASSGVEWRWRRECPKFSGVQAEYKAWKGQVRDWIEICGEEVKYPGLEIRMSLKGKGLEVTEDIDREELKESNGPDKILRKLDEVYLKDTLMENYGKMKSYFKIERESNEKMRDFVIRYEKAASECKKAIGKEMFEGEAKGFHILEQANLSESQKQMVLAACGEGKLEYDKVSQIMKRIFEGLGGKDEGEWLGTEGYHNFDLSRGKESFRSRGRWNRGRAGRNPLNREGRVTLCAICRSEWHWARDCPQNYQNKKKTAYLSKEESDVGKLEEEIYIGEVSTVDEEPWEVVEAILDTGCKSTVCGEL